MIGLRASIVGLSLCAALSACGGDDGPAAGPDAGPVAPDAGDPGAVIFEPGHVLEVELVLPAADWDRLRSQTRTLLDIFGPDCQGQPFESPFSYFMADLTLDGTEVAGVGVRKKGFLGSLSETRPSLVVHLDEYTDGLAVDGLDRLTFNNSVQDASLIHQCLSYAVFAAAGIPSPRCNFAHVTVNGDDLGIYVHVESVKKDFLRRHFADPDGDLYEGTLSDFRPGWEATFDVKTNEATADRSVLEGVTTALAASDSELVAALESVIDLDQFVSFWAAEEIVGHWDGYAGNTNNFFVYRDPADDRLRFMPWGVDGTFGVPAPPAVMDTGALANRLYRLPETRARWFLALADILDGAWDEDALVAEVDRMSELIAPYLAAGQDPEVIAAGQDQVKEFVRARRATLEATMTTPPLANALREPLCFADIGTVASTFTTTFGTLGTDPYASGDGALDLSLRGTPVAFTNVGAVVGAGDAGPGIMTLAAVGLVSDGTQFIIGVEIPEESLAPSTLAIDDRATAGYVYVLPAAAPAYLAGVIEGELVLDQAATTGGAPVTGSITGTIYWFD